MSAPTVSIGRLSVTTHLEEGRAEDAPRIARLLRQVATERLERAFRDAPPPRGIWCVRQLDVPVLLELDRPDPALEAAWAATLIDALGQELRRDSPEVVHYAHERDALLDLVCGVATGRLGRAWAWRRLGLLQPADPSADRAAGQTVVAVLGRHPRQALGAVLLAADRVGLAAMQRALGPSGWTAVAGVVRAALGAGPVRPGRGEEPGAGGRSARAAALVAASRLADLVRGSRIRPDPETLDALALLVVAEGDPSVLRRPAGDALVAAVAGALARGWGQPVAPLPRVSYAPRPGDPAATGRVPGGPHAPEEPGAMGRENLAAAGPAAGRPPALGEPGAVGPVPGRPGAQEDRTAAGSGDLEVAGSRDPGAMGLRDRPAIGRVGEGPEDPAGGGPDHPADVGRDNSADSAGVGRRQTSPSPPAGTSPRENPTLRSETPRRGRVADPGNGGEPLSTAPGDGGMGRSGWSTASADGGATALADGGRGRERLSTAAADGETGWAAAHGETGGAAATRDDDGKQGRPTEWAGLLFLLATAAEAGMPDAVLDDQALAARPLPWALQGIGLQLLPVTVQDPAVAAFAGADPGGPPPWELGPPAGDDELARLADIAHRWASVTAAALAEAERDPLDVVASIARRAGLVDHSPGWLEIHLDLDQVDLAVRRAGLDLDPGWVPWLGTVVRYVYA